VSQISSHVAPHDALRSRPIVIHHEGADMPHTPGVKDRLVITIDGTAGTGKSSVARDLAQLLGLDFLDTGAMYRAATLLVIEHQLNPDDENDVAKAVREADLRFHWQGPRPTLLAGGKAVCDDRLRADDVNALVSKVAANVHVRRLLVERQRRMGEVHRRLVSEGRDQGTVVFYDADVKFFLDARPRVRAERRAEQRRAMGMHADVDAIERELEQRDRLDSSRQYGPLACAHDAEVVDTSTLDRAGVVDHLAAIVHKRVSAARLG